MTLNKEVNPVDEFRLAAARLHDATDYRSIFSDGSLAAIKSTHRKIMRNVHPDRVASAYQAEAAAAVNRLNELHQSACQALADGTFGQATPSLVFESTAMRHECVTQRQRFFDMTSGYVARSRSATATTDSIIKVARLPRDNELLATEADNLRRLAGSGDDYAKFYPKLLDSFAVADGRRRLRANAFELLEGFVNLEQVRQRYPGGISPLDMAWIWRRVLWALGGAHESGVLHGAVVPTHIMIHPAMHGVVLVDWCYSVQQVGDSYPALKALVGARRDWYPIGVLKRQAPTESLDLALAAQSMRYVMVSQTVPAVMESYFADLAKAASHESAFQAGVRFDAVLERLGAPYYPRVFRPLNW